MNIPISIVLCLLFTALTGTIAYLFFMLICRINRETNILKTRYFLLKTVIVSFTIPVYFLFEMATRYEYRSWVNSIFATTPTLARIISVIIVMWIAGMIFQGIRLFLKTKQHRLCVKTYQTTDKYQALLKETKEKLGIQSKVLVKEGEYHESPFITGVLMPSICIPYQNYDEDTLRYIFLHELIHYKHRDLVTIYVIRVLSMIYWFHPIFWKDYLLLQYRELLEDACDIAVCNFTKDHRKYIRILLRMVLNSADIQHTAPVFLSESRKDVERRIQNMERYKNQRSIRRILTTILMAAVFCGSIVVVCAAETGVVSGYQKVYDATWEGAEEEISGNTFNALEEVYEPAFRDFDISVETVDTSSYRYDYLLSTSNNSYTLEYILLGNSEKRKVTDHELSAGDKVLVALTVNPADEDIKVGFYMSNGYMRYITGSGNIYHIFNIYEDDTYQFFIQNDNSTAVEVDGYYSIQ